MQAEEDAAFPYDEGDEHEDDGEGDVDAGDDSVIREEDDNEEQRSGEELVSSSPP